MAHVVLLGDSIFDNAPYVPDRPAVIDQLRERLPKGWMATLLAVDGDVTGDVSKQLEKLPDDATDLIVSCGGNDALSYWSLLSEPAQSVAEVLDRFSSIREEFRENYRDMLRCVMQTKRNVTVCTVYDCVPGLEAAAHAALSMFNEVILREAVAAQLSIIDLRLVCTEASDYSELSSIEPSHIGGAKIVGVICNLLSGDTLSNGSTAIHI